MDQFLESIDSELSIRYLRYLIEERDEEGVQLHNRLGSLMISVSRKYEIQGEKGIDLVTGLGFRGLFINRSCGAEVPRSSEVPELNGRLPNGATVWSSTIRRLAITPMDSLMLIIIRHVRSEGDSSRSLGPT